MDILVSAVALLVLLPVLVLIAVIIRCESPGSPLFSQIRWGKDEKKIRIYKFRSMRAENCDPTGVLQTVKNDSRITRVGAFIRRTNLDELPQLWNVLKGDMSLVGPRCHAIGMQAGGMLYEELVPDYHQRHIMRPGLTGLAQMRGLRGPTDRPARARARIAADLHYVNNFSVAFDIRIIIGTIVSEMTQSKGF
ncbi:sugar transferase (plasmid) [Rhizobium sp. 007]|nr:sugar transferase [Rhizobium sp. 007]